jgi:hypothetical protein
MRRYERKPMVRPEKEKIKEIKKMIILPKKILKIILKVTIFLNLKNNFLKN